MIDDRLTESIIDCGIEVHRALGPGLLEGTYRLCLCHELSLRGIDFAVERRMSLAYKGLIVANGFRADLVIADTVIVELKHVEKILAVHEAQLRTYLTLSALPTGLLLNFNSTVLKNGIRRLSNPNLSRFSKPPSSPTTP